MPMRVKTGASTWSDEVKQPYLKLDSGVWLPAKKILYKQPDTTWAEVWPTTVVYTHYNYGYNLNMFTLFGSPTKVANYIFINKGYIGGTRRNSPMDVALRTGYFPPGSKLTFINEGYVSGAGGDGGGFWGKSGACNQPTGGADGLCLEYPVLINNTNGYIQGGGGGGGGSGDFAGKTYWGAMGGGGAGLPGGVSNITGWGQPGGDGNIWSGGIRGRAIDSGGSGGGPGAPGITSWDRVNDDRSKMEIGAPPGTAILYSGNVLPGSTGLTADRVKGKTLGGWPGYGRVAFNYLSGDGNYGTVLDVVLYATGTNVNVTAAWIDGGSNLDKLTVNKVSNSHFQFYCPASEAYGSPGRYNTWAYGTMRFNLTSSYGSDSFDMFVRVGLAYRAYPPPDPNGNTSSCFVAGSLITMADGTEKAIEEIVIGDTVKTAVGVSTIYQIDKPILGQRPLFAFPDGKCKTSGEHSMWSRQPDTEREWWATRDMAQWQFEADNGYGPNFDPKPLDLTNLHLENKEWEFATLDGWVRTSWNRLDVPEDTQLYHLLLSEGGSYYVDGYLVSSMADTGGVDWEQYKHR